MVTASGYLLLEQSALSALREHLVPIATVVTPNLPESAMMTGAPVASTEAEMIRQAMVIHGWGTSAVLVKGGHAQGPESTDLLIMPDDIIRFSTPRIVTRNVHGTGCTLSSAIAAGLARGLGLQAAIGAAKSYITAAITGARTLNVGHGQGPTHHFHAWCDQSSLPSAPKNV